MTDQTHPQSGEPAEPVDAEVVDEAAPGEQPGVSPDQPTDEGDSTSPSPAGPQAHPDTALAAERLGDLQRLQAEYVNYKRRVDRDRPEIQQRAVADVLDSLLPVLDEISLAREHGDLTDGPFAVIADKLEGALGRHGLERYGAVGEAFDPTHHEALMRAPWDPDDAALPQDATATTVVAVLQPGYRAGDRVLRAARVAVADPEQDA